ncbi:aminoglycoside phosphotransferase family protein [Nocardioides litoris]|uniref:aminoglycoside phosphotransferase family protein n=1 Tax=Nocardioides litoris TaxID=1926648 RepID=UPI0011242BF9|nr:aminoglycoside phosphotransferase family protein [Nocardioides litoris]
MVVAVGDVVVKAHRAGDAPAVVAARAALAARLPELLAPVALPGADLAPYVAVEGGRAVTVWPRGVPLDREDPDAAPWRGLGGLLARLHRREPEEAGGLAAAGPDRVARSVEALRRTGRDDEDARAVLAAAATLAPWTCGQAPWPSSVHGPVLVHGDVHLGQLVDAGAGLVLLDVDDLGVGVSAWDLARPAAWFLTGLVGEQEWGSLLGGYADAGGPLTTDPRGPWPELEPAARALTVQTAARGLLGRGGLPADDDLPRRLLVEACRRIAAGGSVPGPL